MLFTKEAVPYGQRLPWLRPIDLDFAPLPLWRSTEPKGWWLSQDRWPYRDGQHVMTLATRRADAAKEPSDGISDESNWYLTHQFGSEQAALAAPNAMAALLSVYAKRLGDLRDRVGVNRFPRRPVREGRDLDEFLIRDGLDAATVTSALELVTRDLTYFRREVPRFVEQLGGPPERFRSRTPLEYAPFMYGEIREQAVRLAADMTTTTRNVRASAELRQAIANTRLQRFILSLAVAATVIAVIGLLIAKH